MDRVEKGYSPDYGQFATCQHSQPGKVCRIKLFVTSTLLTLWGRQTPPIFGGVVVICQSIFNFPSHS